MTKLLSREPDDYDKVTRACNRLDGAIKELVPRVAALRKALTLAGIPGDQAGEMVRDWVTEMLRA